jgi:hypothetical protein
MLGAKRKDGKERERALSSGMSPQAVLVVWFGKIVHLLYIPIAARGGINISYTVLEFLNNL